MREAFPISDVVIPAGEYWFHEATAALRLPRSDLFRGEFEGSVGSFYDGNRIRLSLGPVWVVSKYLELEAGYEVNRLDFADRGVATTAQLGSLRVKTALNPKVSMSTLGQYNNATDKDEPERALPLSLPGGHRPLGRLQRGFPQRARQRAGAEATAVLRAGAAGEVHAHVREVSAEGTATLGFPFGMIEGSTD